MPPCGSGAGPEGRLLRRGATLQPGLHRLLLWDGSLPSGPGVPAAGSGAAPHTGHAAPSCTPLPHGSSRRPTALSQRQPRARILPRARTALESGCKTGAEAREVSARWVPAVGATQARRARCVLSSALPSLVGEKGQERGSQRQFGYCSWILSPTWERQNLLAAGEPGSGEQE